MHRVALGISMHSGWGVLVAVSGDPTSLQVIDRRRITVTDLAVPGAAQPYHYAANLGPTESERHLAKCAAISECLASEAIAEVVRELEARHYRVLGSAMLLASGRPLPSLAKILASHPLIHTAEGEFYRHAASQACEGLKIPVTAIRERDLPEQAKAAFGNAASRVERAISTLGKSIGPPWTKDHKNAALAAATILNA
jgi:hypothetical protein